mmetsp:Transcript_12465/g.24855  ORF Transcript_12465/g.24855 Transcript_12465/m.24855 type:complete len:339 (+) Transcript_12465:111-1127(+)|eukprot:CAMPEP_0194324822 /NCGR_PEP_ID=MMETSP0171-20130528/28884_1 /TAXON_ID=218684 /ORGANISM="Corethron pennatum, Strain L29A3" /LENGTH=338 /DNA_ID=CAMNT_0039083809 /DNA_START=71 /DNA_END=1087 /DNA_ORIENTATION=-
MVKFCSAMVLLAAGVAVVAPVDGGVLSHQRTLKSGKGKKGTKSTKTAKRSTFVPNRNNVRGYPESGYPLGPAPGKKIGKLLEKKKFEIESWIGVKPEEEYPAPLNEIYESCSMWKYNVSDSGELMQMRALPSGYGPDGKWYHGGCTIGEIYDGDVKGYYAGGAYATYFNLQYLNLPNYPSDYYGQDYIDDQKENNPEDWNRLVESNPTINFEQDNSRPHTSNLAFMKGSGWLKLDICTDDGTLEWINFDTFSGGSWAPMFQVFPNNVSPASNTYSMNVEKSRGCEGKFIFMVLVNMDGYNNMRSHNESMVHGGEGCPRYPAGNCTFFANVYELLDDDE